MSIEAFFLIEQKVLLDDSQNNALKFTFPNFTPPAYPYLLSHEIQYRRIIYIWSVY